MTRQVLLTGWYRSKQKLLRKMLGIFLYPGFLKVNYDWTFTGDPTHTEANENQIGVKWGDIGDFTARVTAELITKENISLTATSRAYTVSLNPAQPTSLPGGPYIGGIIGGNFSPIQFDGNSPDFIEAPEKEKLENAQTTWNTLLTNNPAYVWQKGYIKGEREASRTNLENFMESNFGEQKGELLIFSGGTTFEYSRTVGESGMATYSTSIDVGTAVEGNFSMAIGMGDIRVTPFAGVNLKAEFAWGASSGIAIGTTQSYGGSWESGLATEQTVGFVLSDDDVGDNISTYVLEGPWGTPIFFTDPGSVTSDPWDPGTNKAVDVILELVDGPTGLLFDYHDGAHYNLRISYTGKRELEDTNSSIINFVIYLPETNNPNNLSTMFNDHPENDLIFGLSKSSPTANILFSAYPPKRDRKSSDEKTYPVVVRVEEHEDNRIYQHLPLELTFADLRSPRATIITPYNDQRISPVLFTGDDKFEIEAFSDDHDVAKIQIEIRSKKTNGVWEPWRLLSGMVWADATVKGSFADSLRSSHDGATNENVTIVTHTSRSPVRREFTFHWSGSEISNLGVGEYALRAVAEDKATQLSTDGTTQEAYPNVDLDAPIVSFQVDGSKPTVLTTTPFYQDKESERIYRGELSVTFNDDMRGTDFSDRTFEVTDLLDNKTRVAGFVSYSPALRKTLFVSQVPFRPNGFYFVTIKTDEEQDDGTIEKGVHDLAGNPLDNEFTMTFRTKDTPFEETWSLVLSAVATGSVPSTDANNYAAVEFGAEDGVDEKDAHAVPKIASQFNLSFLNRDQIKFDRDVRPADGRLSHHWFFAISNPGGTVTINYQPSVKLAKSPDLRQYKVLKLIEFDENGNISNSIALIVMGK